MMQAAGNIWIVENLNERVDDEFNALPKDIQARFLRLAELVEEIGVPALKEPYIKHIEGKLWEMRVKAKSGIGRGFYCTVVGKRVIVLRYFHKKTPKTPKNEIEIALRRMKSMR